MRHTIPFAISHSADELHAEPRLVFSAPRRRASGRAELTEDGLRLVLDDAGTTAVTVPYETIVSAVFSPGLLRNRLRLTARRTDAFTAFASHVPNELTLIMGRRHREDARTFVAALRARMADAATPPGNG
jgi:hypothetical protein